MTRGLRVRPRGVVMRWKGVDKDPREIGSELGVQVMVEGNVRRTPQGLRINARVLSVADGFQLWAKRFDRPEKDLFVVNDEVAKAIADALTVDLASPAREAPTDPVAVELYLKARVEYRKFWVQHVREAVRLLEQALERAPNDPTILAGYASALARMAFAGAENAGLAKAAAERALAAAPHLPEAHLAMAHAVFQLGDGPAAVKCLRQAITRAPALAEAHAVLGMILSETGPLNDALRELETAFSLDPAASSVSRNLSRIVFLRGDWGRALELMEKTRQIEGDASYWANLARLVMWRKDDALAEQVITALVDRRDRVAGAARDLGGAARQTLALRLARISGDPLDHRRRLAALGVLPSARDRDRFVRGRRRARDRMRSCLARRRGSSTSCGWINARCSQTTERRRSSRPRERSSTSARRG